MNSFSSIIQGDLFKLSIVFFIVGALIMMLMTKLRKQFSQNKKSIIIYLILVLITFALVGLLSSDKVLNDTPLNSFLGFQLLFLLLGVGHIFVMKNYFQGITQDKTAFFTEFLFTVVVACIGLIAFFNVVNIFRPDYKFIFLASITAFITPLLFYKLYIFATLIPVPVYKKWLYPVGENIKDPTPKELENPLVISFEFRKQENLNDVTNFRVKAPEAMEFGKLFYFFINDYNERHPESKIEFIDNATMEPQGWIFYFKPNWWSSIKHINFLKTISGNNIKEDNVIICQRVDS
ncbi:TssN family type VI secretion system protein [Bizionia paragorgiae]|uniref:TssN family type VI secretion system protein n=1 Tax=Bizionia paragorgiae TaxID=283786 RepID=UPI00299F39C2|nr:TssN family type VI secretion system protein [Bizionia paragorgiae]MDX1270537.1 TssN family type VI secretion system protein [Bizionia paragorgiae]